VPVLPPDDPLSATTPPLHPPVEPYQHGMMDTGEGHQVYFEQCGNPQGLPVVVLHGGPASGCSPLQRRFFDPAVFRIVLFDQRGCGRSTPRGGLTGNDTAALLRDIEQLRRQLEIPSWVVFGGSWGASLAIAYAAGHLPLCLGVILRGTFLTGSRDLDWFFGGAGSLLPQAWQQLTASLELPLTLAECGHAGHAVLAKLEHRLFCEDAAVAGAAAAAWAAWEEAVSRPGLGSPAAAPSAHRDLVDKYRVQSHYLAQQCFLGEERLLELAGRLAAVPVEIVHGRLDWVCRPANAWQVHQAVPGSNLTWVDQSGHNPYEPKMLKALGQAIRAVQVRVGS
jgi:proline iminopeptidase